MSAWMSMLKTIAVALACAGGVAGGVSLELHDGGRNV